MNSRLLSNPSSSLQQSGGVFQASRGGTVRIHGGQFVQHNQAQGSHNCHDADDGLKHLQAHVATTAFDSGQHVDAPKCHPNTRQAVLDEIMKWIVLAVARVQWVLWLNGAAGAGKSAIGRSIVELCFQRNIPIARFFFFRTDSTRNNIKPLVATLVHQLLQSIPDLTPIVIPRIQRDSLIFTKSLETQFEYLIFDPLRELKRQSSFLRMLVLFFDGVDECDDHTDQASLIRIVANFVGSNSFPLIAFFASRTESQISTVFRSSAVAKVTRQLALDNNYLPDDDIRLFLQDSFMDIKNTHQFRSLLPIDWPGAPDVQEIIIKSSGQFIYASVVVNFISTPDLHPGQQLEIVRGLRPCGELTPFAQLDALYRHIFSQVRDIEGTSRILAWSILSQYKDLSFCAEFFELQEADVFVALASLKSVIDYEHGPIHFLHASLPDFLLDRTRSQEFYIDRATWSTRLSIRKFKFLALHGHRGYSDIDDYIAEAEATPALQECVLSFDPRQIDWTLGHTSGRGWAVYLSAIQQMDFGDGVGGCAYQQQLNVVVRYLSESTPSYLNEIEETHAIADILAQMDVEYFSTWKDASARQKWQNIKSINHLGADVSIAIQDLFRSEIEARDSDWTAREADLRRVLNQEKEVALKNALAAEREAHDSERRARDVEIREEKAAIERRWLDREAEIRREEREATKNQRRVPGAETHLEELGSSEHRKARETEVQHEEWGALPVAARVIRSRLARLFKS
ncbi:hypothetical protein HYPSUDRAFT_638364 [Hypholoma sublateritium FD-334 SS-4]|uniref:Nephrocystin 3-like N-terminal domain-containing protein n=1 Tax=Hypholoma sublateritium (strain FD-334 SS-4) TaxID=945553 RepID=A0A0D2PSR3_HYPSF|nr:hypothetical protein HYPSUDRAFT_638364 [Hypholoma sublateritium FD-334 SS-4]